MPSARVRERRLSGRTLAVLGVSWRTAESGALLPVARGATFGRSCPRPCENAQEPTMWRIFFSIAHFPIAATGLFFFRLTKLRRTFYVQVECLCFHTGWPLCGHSLRSTATAND